MTQASDSSSSALVPLRVGLIGCGRIGSFTRPELRQTLPPGWLPLNHAEAILATPGLRLDSVCDVNPANLERASQAFDVPAFTDFARQIEETRPDIISIATRTSARKDIIAMAARHRVRGIHCEKPLSTNLGDCRRMLAAMAEQDVKLTYGTTRRFMDIYRMARDLLNAGEIGNLTDIEIQFGRTLLLWSHPHSADLLLLFAGGAKVNQVRARCTIENVRNGGLLVDDDPFVDEATVEFDDGTTGRLSTKDGLHVVLTGTLGTLRIGEDGRWIELKKNNGNAQRIAAAPTMSGTARAFHELEGAVRRGSAVSIEPRDVENGMAILLSIAQSALKNGAAVSPGSLDMTFTVTGRYGNNYA